MKKRLASVIIVMLLGGMIQAQEYTKKYWVTFRDKADTTYDLAHPEAFLSQRALERRQRQQIALDSLDLPVSESYIRALEEAGYRVQNRSKWLNGVTIFTLDRDPETRLREFPFVSDVRYCSFAALERPIYEFPYDEEPYIPSPIEGTGDSFIYGRGYEQISQLGGLALHKNGYQGEGMIIGVCDDGFPNVDVMSAFDTLRNEGRILATRDFVWDGNDVYNVHQHGTLVLSTMATYQPGRYVGTAPKASYVLCRTEDITTETPMEEYNWVAAAEYLDSLGADIITTSLGYFYFDDENMSYTLADLDGRTSPMSQGAAVAVSRGMLVLNAAGNDGLADPQHLNVPADVQEVLTVGACTREGDHAYFSSYGPTADGRIKPDVLALGLEVDCINITGEEIEVSGTSLATPIMAGMMACLWQRYPEMTPAQLCDSVRAWGSLAEAVDTMGGYGIPDFGKAVTDIPQEGIAEIAPATFVLCPNPVQPGGEVVLPAMRGIVSVVDLQGRVVMETKNSDGVLHVPSSASGVYFIRIVSETEGVLTGKLIVR